MSFREEFSIIPKTALLLAVVCYLAVGTLLWNVTGQDPAMHNWNGLQRGLFSFGIPLILLVLITLVGYVNADARRRGMRYVMWTLLALFMPQGTGIILYFILRDPLLVECRKCGLRVKKGLAFCPQCGESVSQACPQCHKAAEKGWTHCGFCGAPLAGK